MRLLLLLFLFTFTIGCATRNVKYDRNKILKKYSADYEIFIDNKKTNLETVYLDNKNIENIKLDKRNKAIKIDQTKPTELFELKRLKLDSVISETQKGNEQNIEMVIIDGVPIVDSLLQKTKIDPNAIRTFTTLTQDKMNKVGFCRAYNGNVILITTK